MTKFRPHLTQLEAREVPASFSFQLPDGSIGSGQFSTPYGVDPAQVSQTLTLTDLTVTKDGQDYFVQPGATANYASGVFVGVTAQATPATPPPPPGSPPGSPPQLGDPINVSNGTVTVGSYSAPIAYDAADTREAFQFADGAAGAFSLTIPWGLVDETQASQTLSPTTFNLNIAGQNFALGSASYTGLH